VVRSFAAKLLILTTALAVIISIVNYLIPFFQSFQSFTWYALLFFFIVTLITGYIGLRAMEKSAHGFIAGVNGMVMVKLFMSVIFVIVYVLLAKPNKALFITSFFILYVIYSVFEIRELILAQKIQQKQNKDGSP
jgi:hypothetical protein